MTTPARVVQVDADAGRAAGTGYLVGPRLVLTTRQLLGKDAPAARVRPPQGPLTPEWVARQAARAPVRLRPAGRPPEQPASAAAVVWWHPQADVALLLVTDPDWPLLDPEDLRTTWSEVDGTTDCAAGGFPRRPSGTPGEPGVRLADEVHAVVRPGRARAQTMTVEPAVPPTSGSGGTWGGFTGAALLAEDLLVGVLASGPAQRTDADGPPPLQAVPAHRFAANRDLIDWVTADAGPGTWTRSPAGPTELRRRREQDERGDIDWPVVVGHLPAADPDHHPRPSLAVLLDDPAGGRLHAGTTTLLRGDPGSGTSALAAAHARAVLDAGSVDVLVWADARTRAGVLSAFAAAGNIVCPSARTGADEQAAKHFLAWLRSTHRSWLVVLDDVAEPVGMRDLWPHGASGQVVTTSRHAEAVPAAGAEIVEVDVLTDEDAAALLVTALPGVPQDVADDLARDLGGLPLALAQAVAGIRERGTSADDYREQLRVRRGELGLASSGATDGASTVLATTTLAVDRADEHEPHGLAQLVLILVSVLAPTFPVALLRTTSASRAVATLTRPRTWRRWITPAHALTGDQMAQALDHLCDVGLASVDDDGVAHVHELVQQVVREQLDRTTFDTAVCAAADALLEAWPYDDGLPSGAAAAHLFRDGVATVAALDVHHVLWRPDGHAALWTAGASLVRAGLHEEAVARWEGLVEEAAHRLGDDHVDTVTSRNNLALAHRESGRLDRAVGVLEATLEDAERTLGPAHHATLTCRNNLAMAYRDGGQHEHALAMLLRNVTDAQRTLGAGHPDTLLSRTNLALAHRDAGRVDLALPLLQRSLSDAERSLGVHHPDTVATRTALALAHRAARRFDRALPLLEHALADRERVLGPDHPDTLTSRLELGQAYRDARRVTEALPVLEQAVADAERALGPDHPTTRACRRDLALAYKDVRRFDEALPLLERLLSDAERAGGPQHLDALESRSVLARAYHDAGRVDRAVPLLERTLADREQVLGSDDPDTLASRHDLATALRDAGRPRDALRLMQRTFGDRQRVLGEESQETLASRHGLALTLRDTGRLDTAVVLLEGTLTDRDLVLGPGHPDTMTSRHDLAMTYRLAGRADEALPMLERTLAERQRMLGPWHVDTATSRRALAVAYREVDRVDEALALEEVDAPADDEEVNDGTPIVAPFV